jgi:hypothetical protein
VLSKGNLVTTAVIITTALQVNGTPRRPMEGAPAVMAAVGVVVVGGVVVGVWGLGEVVWVVVVVVMVVVVALVGVALVVVVVAADGAAAAGCPPREAECSAAKRKPPKTALVPLLMVMGAVTVDGRRSLWGCAVERTNVRVVVGWEMVVVMVVVVVVVVGVVGVVGKAPLDQYSRSRSCIAHILMIARMMKPMVEQQGEQQVQQRVQQRAVSK